MRTEGRSKITHIMQMSECHRFGHSLDAHSTYEDGHWADRHGGIVPRIVGVGLVGLALPDIGGYCPAGPGEGRR